MTPVFHIAKIALPLGFNIKALFEIHLVLPLQINTTLRVVFYIFCQLSYNDITMCLYNEYRLIFDHGDRVFAMFIMNIIRIDNAILILTYLFLEIESKRLRCVYTTS